MTVKAVADSAVLNGFLSNDICADVISIHFPF